MLVHIWTTVMTAVHTGLCWGLQFHIRIDYHWINNINILLFLWGLPFGINISTFVFLVSCFLWCMGSSSASTSISQKSFMDKWLNFFKFRFDFLCFYATFYWVRFLRFIKFFFRFDKLCFYYVFCCVWFDWFVRFEFIHTFVIVFVLVLILR